MCSWFFLFQLWHHMYDVWLQSLHFLRQETYFVPIFFLGSYESAGRQFPNRKQEARISNNGYHNTCSWQNWLASQECLEYGRDFLHLCWAVSQNGIRDFGLIRPNFETQRTNWFFFFFFGLRDLRQFVRSLYKVQALTIAIVIQRLGMMRDSIHHLLVVLILYCK